MTTKNLTLAGNWIHTAWRTLPHRYAGLPWEATAEKASEALNEAKLSKVFDSALRRSTTNFHQNTRTYLWKDHNSRPDHDKDLTEESRDHRLNLTAILLSTNIAYGTNSLPDRNTKNLELWMSTGCDWVSANKSGMWDFYSSYSPEAHARHTLENAWHNLTNNQRNDDKDYYWSNNFLRWENTAICAMDAIYTTTSSFEQARDINRFKEICDKTHKLMIKHNLWGDDSRNPDRSDENGNPKAFDQLSKEMKENYVIIVLATLSGLSDYMKDTKKAAT